jgi:hypothetical protein
MANVHILERTGNGYRVAVHIPTPAGNNAAAVAWSAALLRSGRGGTTELPDGDGTGGTILAAEKLTITNGTVMELIETIEPPPTLAGAALLTWLDQWYAAKVIEVQNGIQARLNQYGRVR